MAEREEWSSPASIVENLDISFPGDMQVAFCFSNYPIAKNQIKY